MSEVIGIIKVIGSVQQVSASFKKREIVITTDSQYPQHIPIEFKQDKTDILDSYKVGEPVKVSTNLTGREWISPSGETKYFLGCEGWRIERNGSPAPAPLSPTDQYFANKLPPIPAADAFAPATNLNEEEADDLPF